jgi:CBS domain-containing protein
MQKDVCAVFEGESVLAAAEIMRDENIGFLPVLDNEERLVGTVTDRDLALRCLAFDKRPSDFTVGDVMSPGVIACAPEDELRVASSLMKQHRKSRIVVIDDGGELVGVISLVDIAALDSQRHAARTLRGILTREYRS